MKRLLPIVIAVTLALGMFLCGCGGEHTGGKEKTSPLVSTESIDENLRWFLGISDGSPDGDMGNRIYGSEAERHAAVKLYDRFADAEKYPDFQAYPISSTSFEAKGKSTETIRSQNVVVRFGSGGSHTVIVGTGYDGGIGEYEVAKDDGVFIASASTGVLQNATGVATVLSVMDYCNAHSSQLLEKFDLDILFVFYGGSNYATDGAEKLLEFLPASEVKNIVLSVSIDRLGCQRTYMYADEVETGHEKFMLDIAADCGFDYYTLPQNIPVIEAEFISGVQYTHYGMLSENAAFIERDIPALRIFGGYYGGFNLSDCEMKSGNNIGMTTLDTYGNLRKLRPEYARQGSETATLVVKAVTHSDFITAMLGSKESKPDYLFWTNSAWAYIIVAGVIALLAVALIIAVKLLEKKYPYVPPRMKRMKIAVFGMDYEDKDGDEIFVDIRRKKDPFDGY